MNYPIHIFMNFVIFLFLFRPHPPTHIPPPHTPYTLGNNQPLRCSWGNGQV